MIQDNDLLTALEDLYRDGPVPDHSPGFWDRIDGDLATMPSLRAEPTDTAVIASAPTDFDLPPVESDNPTPRPTGMLLAAAAVLAVLGLGTWWIAGFANEESTVFAGDDYPSQPQPIDPDGTVLDGSADPVDVPEIGSPLDVLAGMHWFFDDTVLFTVESDLPLQTRFALLDRLHDSGILPDMWLGESNFSEPDGSFSRADLLSIDTGAPPFEGQATISVSEEPQATCPARPSCALGTWRPVPANATGIRSVDEGVLRSQPNLMATSETPLSSLRYEVDYLAPVVGLNRTEVEIPADVEARLPRYLALPEGTRDVLVDAAAEIVIEGEAPSINAKRLEGRFRQIEIDPIPSAAAGPSTWALVLEFNRGTHQRIVGTFAAMARAIGIPSRVVVGFHEGTRGDDGWLVRGSDATAWVELFIDGRWQAYSPAADRPEVAAPTVSLAPREEAVLPDGTVAVPTEAGSWVWYVVEAGDTVESIAENFNVDVDLLLDVNFEQFDPALGPAVGQEIVIPTLISE